ncbi:AfsR/SARP family transcriptional regulator [Streptomyces albipurpureus]|uniref:AfsR/SARP family transcriptional regulator n=1 Tax=Streptomyces albipurpureus TaxID=2897419 RepID=A0ABT0UGS8_9ACTN|nr:AfsR/SARP family transcriptional regulator [Streptomyces sp. CWNU-1]MCM2387234.1 AfsR/SARP family transcriptional regulator [Streptomyces sp. CWNU-1]
MIEIGLLGSFRVIRDGVDVTPSAPKLRQVLTLLVLNANALVSVDQLCAELWGELPPLSALTTLQTYIYQLRRKLRLTIGQSGAPFGSCPPRESPALLTRVGGYELRLADRKCVDAFRFEQLVQRGKAEYRAGSAESASATFKEALAVWHGDALVDVAAGRRLSLWATQLQEQRKGILEQRFAVELELGHHQTVLDELSAEFRTCPTHEAFAGQLMRALHRGGRRAEALDVFRTLRARLVEELGLEPSAALQRLHQEVLTDRSHIALSPRNRPEAAVQTRTTTAPASERAPDRTGPAGPPAAPAALAPAQLPADIADFVGRSVELGQLEEYLRSGGKGGAEGRGVRLVEVHGPPGVGKTAFAVRAAHRLRPHFPDGQLFMDLSRCGNGSSQLADVLATSLSSCDIRRPSLPTGLDELGQLFRSWTADRRVLVVVDDVLAASQLRALMPGGSGCAVIATNRYRSHGLATGRKIVLPALSNAEALSLYEGVADARQRDDDRDSVRDLVYGCEGLPLLIRAVAGRLATRPGWSAARLNARLRSDPSLLLGLPAGTQSLLCTVESSYRHLSPRHRDLLRLMAESSRARWNLKEVTELLPRPAGDTETLLEYLVDVHLVDELDAPLTLRDAEPVYRLPRLIRHALLALYGEPSHASRPVGDDGTTSREGIGRPEPEHTGSRL